MEVLRRRRGVDELDVVLGSREQEALDARRRVLRTLAVIAVRKQQDETVALPPLVLGGDEVLVDDHLGAVDEVAELGLPEHQRLGRGLGVPVLEPEGGVLRQQRVVDPEPGVLAADSIERNPRLAGLVVDQRGVALGEGAAPRVLAGEADAVPLGQQRPEGQCLGGRPLDLAFGEQLGPRLELLGQLRVRR